MSIAAIGMLAPKVTRPGGFHVGGLLLVIIVLVAVLGIAAILGWRSRERSPGADTKAERERIED